MARKCITLALVGLLLTALGLRAGDPVPEDYLQEISGRFTPAKPTVVMQYSVHYRFLSLNLLQVANATIETTEGYWRAPGADKDVPCAVIDVHLLSPSAIDKDERVGRMYINDRIVSVVTMPELETLYYLKMTDELLNPILGAKKDLQYFHVYDLAGGDLEFFSHDYRKNISSTNLTGATDMASQGREVARVLNLLSDLYHERCGPISPDSDFRIFVNCDSKAIPFAARSERTHIEAFGGEYTALRVDVMPAREAPKGVRTRDFTVWAASFMDVAERTANPNLLKIAEETPAWGMTPLIADYGMPIGHIRLSLVDMKTQDSGAGWFSAPEVVHVPTGPREADAAGY